MSLYVAEPMAVLEGDAQKARIAPFMLKFIFYSISSPKKEQRAVLMMSVVRQECRIDT